MTKRTRITAAFYGLALLALLGGCATIFSPKYSDRGPKMDTSMWEEHCVGRYTIRLPMGSKTTLSTKYWPAGPDGTKFEYLEGVKKDDVPRIVAARIAELEKRKNSKTQGPMFLGKIDFPNGGVGILRWNRQASDARQTLECYLPAKGGQEYVFKFVYVGVSPSEPDFGISFCRLVAENLYSREPDEVPKSKGFVVDHGFVAVADQGFRGKNRLNESSELIFSVPDFPRRTFSLKIRNLAGDPIKLLDQVDPDYIMMNYTDKKIIRRGTHNAGDIPGQEICISGERDGFTSFECQWGSPGKYRDLANQALDLDIQVRTHEGKGRYPTQEELLLLWDTIISTIRLRPGAV